VLLGALTVAAAATVVLAVLHRSGSATVVEHRGPSTSAPPPVRPRHTAPATAAVLAREGDRAITRLEGLGLPVFCGGARGDEVALTFDDGPGPYTARALAVLRRYHAPATFFIVGNRVHYWPRLPAAEATIGAVGDHTWSHPDLTRLSRRAAKTEIDRARAEIASAANTDVRLFRTPYGRDPSWLGRALAARALLEIRWSVDSSDYLPHTTVAGLVRRVAPGLKPGAIVLLHDLRPTTVRALPALLHLIRAKHLRAVTVPELLRDDPPSYRQLIADNRGRGCVDLATAGSE
jgi:peptidoglycan/xylan/chitin deacetylase (PgdA/CDA1 family)